MGIDLSGQNGFMSQHFLNGPQIGTPVNQFSGKGMPKCMWTETFFLIPAKATSSLIMVKTITLDNLRPLLFRKSISS